jgi:endonuclease/exonuclease/phosphatase family metal-dependent hydrolase
MVVPYIVVLSLLLLIVPAFNPNAAQRKSEKQKPAPPKAESLLEIGVGPHASTSEIPKELKVVSYNIRWRGGEDLQKLIELFRRDPGIGRASILGLQEVDRNKKRTDNINTVKLIADELRMHYAWTAPPGVKADQEEETGVAILSIYPLSDVQRIVLPHEGPGHRRRVAIGATVTIGNRAIRYYSVHSETRVAVDKKIQQMQAVLTDLDRYPKDMPAIILGDFNTWESSAVTKTRKLFTNSGFETPFDDRSTFSRKIVFIPIELKLDWIWLRNLEVVSNGVERKISLSDHWPMWCVVKLKSKA